jgi:hypothetical protein
MKLGALVYTIIEAPGYGWTAGRTLAGLRLGTSGGAGLPSIDDLSSSSFCRVTAPFQTGLRILPAALSIAFGSVAGTQLAVTRLGTKAVVFTGLLILGVFPTRPTPFVDDILTTGGAERRRRRRQA